MVNTIKVEKLLKREGKTKRTIECYLYQIKKFFKDSNKTPTQSGLKDVQKHFVRLKRKGVCHSYVAQTGAGLSAFFKAEGRKNMAEGILSIQNRYW